MLNNLSPEKIASLIGKLKVLITLALCVWLANIAAQAVWMLVSPEPLPRVASQKAISGKGQSTSTQQYSIVSELLFGEAPKQAEQVQEVAVVDAPKTRLRLKLLGVFVGQTSDASTAIISEQGKADADFFRIGDTVQNGVSLEQVHADRVILNRSGRLEALYFDDAESLFDQVNKTPAKKVAQPSSKNRAQINTVQQFASAAKKQWQASPLTALGAVGFVPVSKEQALGYRFSGHNPMMERYGIQKGDVIRSVNGIDVGDVSADGDHLDGVFEQGEASIVVERGSRQFEVTIPLK